MTIKGLVFDFDGLILDTETPEYIIWQEIYGSYGTEMPITEWGKALGASLGAFDPTHHLEELTGRKIDRDQMLTDYRQRSNVLIAQQKPLPGVTDYLHTAHQLKLKLAVASSSPNTWVTGHLSRLELIHHFDAVRTSEDVVAIKPAPYLYQAALKALGLRPEEAIAFEDSPNGIIAAQAAGLFCVAVPNPVSRLLDVTHADLVLNSLADLPLEQLIQQVEARQAA